MIRTFIALDIPETCRKEIDKMQQEFKAVDAAVSWVNVSRIHLTLKFLGNIPPEQVPVVSEVLQRVAAETSPFSIQPAGCGAFPTIKQMRIVWVGLKGDMEPMVALQKRLDHAMTPLGFKPEDRPFKPHLTLGRVKGRRGLHSVQEVLLAQQCFQCEPFNITEIVLYKSELKPDGARYSALFRAPFTGDSRL